MKTNKTMVTCIPYLGWSSDNDIKNIVYLSGLDESVDIEVLSSDFDEPCHIKLDGDGDLINDWFDNHSSADNVLMAFKVYIKNKNQ